MQLAERAGRFERMPKDAKGWSVFDLERAAKAGEVVVDPGDVAAYTPPLQRH